MNIRRTLHLVGFCTAVFGVTVACSSSSTTTNGNGGGGDDASSSGDDGATGYDGASGGGDDSGGGGGGDAGGGGGSCKLQDGTYKTHYTGDGGVACPVPQDQTFTIPSDAGGGTFDAGNACTTTTDTSTCTITTSCEIHAAGYTTTTKNTFVIASSGTSGMGTFTSKTVQDASGTTLSSCSYEYTTTKQ